MRRATAKFTLLGLVLSLVLSINGGAFAAIVWDANGGVGGDWFNPLNWTGTSGDPDNTIPTASDFVEINDPARSSPADPVVIATQAAMADNLRFGYYQDTSAGYLAISNDLTVTNHLSSYRGSAGVVQTAGTVSAGSFFWGERATPMSTWELQGGSFSTSGDFVISRGDSGSIAQFLQSGGTTVDIGGNFQMGTFEYTGGAGLYDMASGSLTVDGNTLIAWKAKGQEFRQSGGIAEFAAFNAGTDVNDAGHGTVTLSEEAQFHVNATMTIGSTGSDPEHGTGVLVLDGSRTGAGTDLMIEGNFSLNEWGTLQGVIDTDAIGNPSLMRKVDVAGNVRFGDGALLLPEFDAGVTPALGTWTLVTWDGTLTDNGLMLDPSAAEGWSLQVDDVAKALTVTYTPETIVPEPASVTLMGLAALLLLGLVSGRRKR